MLMPGTEKPKYSPGPWTRGVMYVVLALGALAYGHLSGERPLTFQNGAALGAIAIAAGIAIALLQNWARNAATDSDEDPS